MCNFGGSQTTQQTQNQTSTYTPNPTAMAAYQGLIPQIQQVGSTPYNPATGQKVADLSPDQQQAFNQIRGLQGVYQPYMDQAGQLTGQAGQAVNGSDIAQYMSPYTQQVINSTMDQLNQRFGEQQSQLSGNAALAGALGGNRLGVAQGVLGGEQGRTMASTIAGLENQAYSQALNQANATKAQQLAAGNQFAGLGGLAQQYGLTGAGALYGAGQAQQQQQQNVNNADTANATAQTMRPYQNLQFQTGLLGALGPLMGGTTNSSGTGTATSQQNPGLMQYLGLGAGAFGLLSDERAKENIREVGKLHDGQPIYAYNYIDGGPTQLGLLAQEVEHSHPEAVGRAPGGLKTVNYDAATADSTRPGMAGGGMVMPPLMQFNMPATQGPGGMGDLDSMYSLGQKARAGLHKLFDGIGQTSGNGWGANFETSGGSPWSNMQAGLSNLGSALGFADGGLVTDDPEAVRNAGLLGLMRPSQQVAVPLPSAASGVEAEPHPDMSPDLLTSSGEKFSRGFGELWRRFGPELDTRRGGFFEAAQQPQPTQPAPQAAPAVAPAQTAQPSPVPEDIQPAPVKTFRVNPFETKVEAQGHPVVSGVIDELHAGKASDSAIRGILANVQDESGFDPSLRHPDQPKWGGEAHYAHGLFQEGGAEWNKYEAWLKANHPGADWTDPRLQTRFLVENLQQNYPSVWKAMNEGTPEEAAKAFLTGYLKPSAENVQRRFAAYDQGIPDLKVFLEGKYTSPRGSGVTTAINPSSSGIIQPQAAAPVAGLQQLAQAAPDKGGLIKRLTGYDFNPLGLDANERMALIAGGLAMAGAPGAATGVNTYLNAQNQDRQQQLEGLKLALHAQQLAQQMQLQAAPSPVSITDQYGMTTSMQRNPLTGELSAPQTAGGTAAPAVGATSTSPFMLNGQEAPKPLQALPPHLQQRAANIIAGNEQVPHMNKSDPEARIVLNALRESNIPIDQARYNYKQQWEKPPTNSTGTGARRVAANTAIEHVGDLIGLVDSLPDHTLTSVNKLSNFWGTNVISDPNLAAYRTAAEIAAGELEKAAIGGKPGAKELQDAKDRLDPSKGKTALKATIAEMLKKLKGSVEELQSDYARNMGPYAAPAQVLTPKNEELLNTYIGQYGRGTNKPEQSNALQAGSVVRGYRFKGGDPSQKENWEKV